MSVLEFIMFKQSTGVIFIPDIHTEYTDAINTV